MIPYYGKHYAKQYIKGKPIRFGFKNWALCTSNGCYIENNEVHVNFWYNRKCQTDAIILVKKIMSENP
ncbi:hypothetical protein NQ315_006116 [Exocentrus adspersus]|uniref:PiggyBac transposable element-derived protein domain-containing protein n=1 Tax=Exocentrus adspersus TaxID=1586481 RepID=A0AAV8VD71_9CUCU|nr:hypothetical protein NQ315_006116 [Exocentrus adspersus]